MEQTSLSIGSIGQQLEAARQAKGVSVSEAGQATKILSKFIEAMEADDFGALSAPVYAKSFIKMYARYLGLDESPLVAEYVSQHASNSKPQISEEVRQNLAKVDNVAVDPNGPPPPQAAGNGNIFGDVNEAIMSVGKRFTPRQLMIAGGALLVILILLAGITQCADGEDEAPAAAGGAASVERQVLQDAQPDLYLVKPGVVEVD